MIDEQRLVNIAGSLFLKTNFKEALFIYSQLSTNFPKQKEYELYALLCDIGYEDPNKALSLYNYFSIAKEINYENAFKDTKILINQYEGDINKMIEIINGLSSSSIDSLNVIRYEDFKSIIKTRGSFKIAFEDIMFSTKVAIESKEQFFDFVNKLIDNDFNTTAYTYLDGFNDHFAYDSKIEQLYKKLEAKKS